MPAPKKNYAVMFVDMVGSTAFKYGNGEAFPDVIEDLFGLIQSELINGQASFTGDGAMASFRCEGKDAIGYLNAIHSAEKILQAVDRLNMEFRRPPRPRIHIRIGIAAGDCYEISPIDPRALVGTPVDLAKRLCDSTEVDTILVDQDTKEKSNLPEHRFERCLQHLALKGIELEDKPFYYFKPARLLRPLKADNFSKGLLALYPDRQALLRDFSPLRLIELTAPGDTLLIAGRTLISWTRFGAEMKHAARIKGLKFQFVICSDTSGEEWGDYLDERQQEELHADLPKAKFFFCNLLKEDGCETQFEVKETPHLILDGITCTTISMPDSGNNDSPSLKRLITIQDINAAPHNNKASFALVCTCAPSASKPELGCLAHGLYRRTLRIFQSATPINRDIEQTPVERLLSDVNEGLDARNNQPARYLHRVLPHLRAVVEERLGDVPAPLCVQLQVSSRCSTHCVMCDHHRPQATANDLSVPEWKKVFRSLAKFGVQAVIFSGGEPLMNPELPALLQAADDSGLSVGLLTNGTMPQPERSVRQEIARAVKKCKWVAISIDGMEKEDALIRKPEITERIEHLKEFCRDLAGGPKISATVTLQKRNIQMDLVATCYFIQRLGIEQVNFKLATGNEKALSKKPEYLLSEEELRGFNKFLWSNPLPQSVELKNNLAYLRRCFARGIYDFEDAARGAPLSSFYNQKALTCFTPYLFSLIDSNGDVYTCCHLYRDNHGSDSSSRRLKRESCLGNIKDKEVEFDFAKLWNGESYRKERERLKRVTPDQGHTFLPCGECTRHCQHNLFLTNVLKAMETEPKFVIASEVTSGNAEPVWF
jgi:MoaA/NifB/PqqE/SkfB family radical SAM enzyme/class 3 adenylate cyclase